MTRTVTVSNLRIERLAVLWNPELQKASVVADYTLLDETDEPLWTRELAVPLTAGQQTALKDFVVNVLIPAIKTKEQL